MWKFSFSGILLLISAICFSQIPDLIRTEYKNEVFCYSKNEFYFHPDGKIKSSDKIVPTSGDIIIEDNILVWENITKCWSKAYLIINEIDSIEFTVKRKIIPEPSVNPSINCQNISGFISRISGIRVDSDEYTILDYDVVFQENPESNPFYLKNYGPDINDFIRSKIKLGNDKSSIIITNVRLINSENNITVITDKIERFYGAYYNHNRRTDNLLSALPLYDHILQEEKFRKDGNSWIHYRDKNEYTELIDDEENIRAKYKWVDSNFINYTHFIEDRILIQGTLKLIEKPFFILKINPETFEEMLEKPKELIRTGIWKEYNENGNVIFEKEYYNDLLISNKGG